MLSPSKSLAILFAFILALGVFACTDRSEPLLFDSGLLGSGDGGASQDAGAPDFQILFIDPANGPFTGGTRATVRGNDFDESTQIFVGGRMVEPTEQEFVDSRRIVITTPPGEPGLSDVEARKNSDVASLPDAFSYEAMVADPPSGSITGGTQVTIRGFGTDFGPTSQVRFDGALVSTLQVAGATLLTVTTPPGISGDADIEIVTESSVYEAKRGFEYLATADPFAAGMGGGLIDGNVNVVVLDSRTSNGVDQAFVSIGDPQTSPLQGYADDLGQISFSDAQLSGRITTSAAAPGYESSSFVQYDSRDITILLRKLPEPPPPDLPPPPPPGVGPQSGRILGSIVFGDATGLGSPVWNLVPEPRHSGEIKRVYVSTTASSIFGRRTAGAIIDYQGFDAGQTSWEFDISTRPSATAVVAMAGLYDTDTEEFQAFGMGVARGVLVGPGENVIGVDVVVDIPLDTAVLVNLDNPPDLHTPGWLGPVEYTIRPVIDLGGEGAIVMSGHGLPIQPAPALRPGTYLFDEGSKSVLLEGMAPLSGNLADASYSFIIGAYSANGASPFSVRIERGQVNISTPLTIGNFIGTPRPSDPAPDTMASSFSHMLKNESPATGSPTFHQHLLVDKKGDPILRTFARGSALRAPIPDFRGKSVPVFPSEDEVYWTFFDYRIWGQTFDDFNYRHLRRDYWSAYAAGSYWVRFPQPSP